MDVLETGACSAAGAIVPGLSTCHIASQEAKAAVQPPEPAAEAPDSTAAAPADGPELDLAIDEEAEDEEDLLALLAEPMDAEAPDGGTQGPTQEDLALPEDDMLGSLPPEAYAAALEDDDDEMALERALAEA